MRKSTKRTVAITAATVVLLAGGGAAFAYWSAGGTGTGTATAGTSVAISAVQTTVLTPLRPGAIAQTISGNFSNTNSNPVYVSTVTASIGAVAKATGAPAGACEAADFALANAVMTVNLDVPSGTAQGAWTGASLTLVNKPANQDACKGATVTLNYVVS
jgi:hypothetical protein